ncbi:MAG TPA: GMC oxidoreductase, partial [Oligoflexia bacterium]|nr:GMC oxidoreductase [Oligoflexia bacterium]
QELGRVSKGRVQMVLNDEVPWPNPWFGGHHIGTTRMHDDPKQGVVDKNCRLHSLENFYIAGSSVFPTPGCSNPTLTVVAMALRLADHLKEVMTV